MCCQYYFDDSTMEDIRQIVNGIDRKLYGNKYGDIHPSDPAMIITGRKVSEDGVTYAGKPSGI